MDAACPPLPDELCPLVRSNAGEPVRWVDEQTRKIYVLVEQPSTVDFDEDYWRELVQPALDDEARGDVAPLDFDAIKRRGREILASRQSKAKG